MHICEGPILTTTWCHYFIFLVLILIIILYDLCSAGQYRNVENIFTRQTNSKIFLRNYVFFKKQPHRINYIRVPHFLTKYVPILQKVNTCILVLLCILVLWYPKIFGSTGITLLIISKALEKLFLRWFLEAKIVIK